MMDAASPDLATTQSSYVPPYLRAALAKSARPVPPPPQPTVVAGSADDTIAMCPAAVAAVATSPSPTTVTRPATVIGATLLAAQSAKKKKKRSKRDVETMEEPSAPTAAAAATSPPTTPAPMQPPTPPAPIVVSPVYKGVVAQDLVEVVSNVVSGLERKKATVSVVGMPDSGRSMLVNAWQSAARGHPCRPLAVGGRTGDEKRRTFTAHTVPIVKGRLDVRVIPALRKKEDLDETLRAMIGCDADGTVIATAANPEQHDGLLRERVAPASDVIVLAIPMSRLLSSDPEDRVDVEDFIVSVTSLSQQYSPDQDRPEVTNAPQLLFVITKVDEVVEPGTGPECLLGKEKSSSASLQLAFTHLKEHGGAPVHTVAMGFLDDDDVAWNNAADPRVVVLKHLSKLCTKWGDRHDEQEDTLRRAV